MCIYVTGVYGVQKIDVTVEFAVSNPSGRRLVSSSIASANAAVKLRERNKNRHYSNYLASIGSDGEDEFSGSAVATGESTDFFWL